MVSEYWISTTVVPLDDNGDPMEGWTVEALIDGDVFSLERLRATFEDHAKSVERAMRPDASGNGRDQ